MAPGFPGIHHMRAEEARATVDWVRAIPLIVVHVLCLGVFLVGWSWTAVSVAIGLYFIRMFAITGWYHRYFSLLLSRTVYTGPTFHAWKR